MTDFPQGHRVIAVGQPLDRPAYDDLPATGIRLSNTRMLNPYRMQHSHSPRYLISRTGQVVPTGDLLKLSRGNRLLCHVFTARLAKHSPYQKGHVSKPADGSYRYLILHSLYSSPQCGHSL